MDFKELNYVVTLAKYRNYTDAAKSLYITQPALTKAIQKLESELGEELFVRKKNSTIPTEFGLKYVHYAQSILNLKSSMDEELRALHEKKYPTLRVGITPISGRYMMSQTAVAFQRKHPHVQLSFTENININLYEMLEKGEIDLAICIRPGMPPYPPCPDLEYIDIITNEIVLAVLPNHPLIGMAVTKPGFRYPWIPLEWAKDEKFLIQPENQYTGRIARALFSESGFQPASVTTLNSVHSAIDLTCAGCGVAIVTNIHLAILEQKTKLTPLSIGQQPILNKSAILYKKDMLLPDYAVDYMEMIRQVHQELAMIV